MKVRTERSGIHLYDRESGLHMLMESEANAAAVALAPRSISIALTNACDLCCPFCYAPKAQAVLRPERVLAWCRELDALGCLEVGFGGGEPTLVPWLADLCCQVWSETDLGITITTHGHHLAPTLIDGLAGHVGLLRISVDAMEPTYSRIRGRPLQLLLDRLSALRGHIPFGFNVVVSSQTLPGLDDVLALARQVAAEEILLLPLVQAGQPALSPSEWKQLDAWLQRHWRAVPLRVAAEAQPFLTCPFLFPADHAYDFAHIGADGCLRRTSFENVGAPIGDAPLAQALRALREGDRPRP